MKKQNTKHSKEWKKIVSGYQKLIIKILDVDDAGAAILDIYDGETLKLYNRLHKLKNGAFVDSAEDKAIDEAVKNVKKLLKGISK